MTKPQTLLQIAGAPAKQVDWSEAALVLIDYQREYEFGKLALGAGGEAASIKGAQLIEHARSLNRPVIHVVHHGAPGGALFDPDAPTSDLIETVARRDGETEITKGLPNAFAGTNLHDVLQSLKPKHVVIAGFMSHMCVSSTTRAALDLGYDSFVAEDACYTRDLEGPNGNVIAADVIHQSAMAALSDRFATVTSTATLVG